MIVQRERQSRYFVSWHGRLLLVATENLRPASADEAAAHTIVSQQAAEAEQDFKEEEEKTVEDLSNVAAPPKRSDLSLKGLRSARKLMKRI